jgi:hypothetical protein
MEQWKLALLCFSVWGLGVVSLLGLIAFMQRRERRRRTGVPGRGWGEIAILAVITLMGCACSTQFFGGPELRREITRYRQLSQATQTVSATVESHRCLLDVSARTQLTYSFSAPDPVTGQPRSYRRTERISESHEQCSSTATPYTLTIWYDPADPQHATLRRLRVVDMIGPFFLFSMIGGCFGLLPLLAMLSWVWGLLRRTPAEKQLAADVKRMEAEGFLVVIEHDLIHATADARANPALRPYVSRYHGQLYLSLDFIADPAERLATWNALWKFQAGTADTADRELVKSLKEQLRRRPGRRRAGASHEQA